MARGACGRDSTVEEARRGETSALTELYRAHHPQVFGLILSMTGNEETAADLAQETWLRALRGLGAFQGKASFGTWLHQIARNLVLQVRRQTRRREGIGANGVCEVAPASSMAPLHNDPLLWDRLVTAMDGLPEGKRQVLILHDLLDHSHGEIASLLGCTPETSRSQLHRARRSMRLAMQDVGTSAA